MEQLSWSMGTWSPSWSAAGSAAGAGSWSAGSRSYSVPAASVPGPPAEPPTLQEWTTQTETWLLLLAETTKPLIFNSSHATSCLPNPRRSTTSTRPLPRSLVCSQSLTSMRQPGGCLDIDSFSGVALSGLLSLPLSCASGLLVLS